MVETDRLSEHAMNPRVGLKWSAAFFTVFWTASMLLWFHPAHVMMTALGGLTAGYIWYRIMCWIVVGRERLPR
jgi:hypothetical protein